MDTIGATATMGEGMTAEAAIEERVAAGHRDSASACRRVLRDVGARRSGSVVPLLRRQVFTVRGGTEMPRAVHRGDLHRGADGRHSGRILVVVARVEDEITESELEGVALQSPPEKSGPPLRTRWLLVAVGVVAVLSVITVWSRPSTRVLTRVWAPGGRTSAVLVQIQHTGAVPPAYQVCVVRGPAKQISLPCRAVAGFAALPSPEAVKFVWRSDVELEIHHPHGTEGHSYAPPTTTTMRSARLGVLTKMVED